MTVPSESERPRAVVFRGTSQYDCGTQIAEDAAAAFRAIGLTVDVIDLCKPDLGTRLAEVFSGQRPLFAYSIVGWGGELKFRDTSLFDALDVTFVPHIVDPPCDYHTRLVASQNQLLLLHDADYGSYIEHSCAIGGARGELPFGTATTGPLAPIDGPRDIGLLAPLSYPHNMDELHARRLDLTEPMRRVLDRAVEECLTDGGRPVHEAVFHAWADTVGDTASSDDQRVQGVHMFAYLLVHAQRRIRLAADLLARDAVIVGRGWEHAPTGGTRRADVRGPVSYTEALALMQRSRVVLNTMPPVTNAPHDRLLYGMVAGAAIVSTRNTWVDAAFPKDELVTIPAGATTLGDTVDALLADPAARHIRAEAARARVLHEHSWEARAREIVDGVIQFRESAGLSAPAAA